VIVGELDLEPQEAIGKLFVSGHPKGVNGADLSVVDEYPIRPSQCIKYWFRNIIDVANLVCLLALDAMQIPSELNLNATGDEPFETRKLNMDGIDEFPF